MSRGTSLRGNRVWRVETPDGPAVQKHFAPRGSPVREGIRALLTALARRKTSPRATTRRETEQRLLALWRQAGFDVPEEVSARNPGFASEHTLLLRFVHGPQLLRLLRRRSTATRAERDDLLRRFAATWRRRHALAIALPEPAFVQEHGSFAHVLVEGERFVVFDLEQAYRTGREVLPLVAKEIAGYLRSLAAYNDPEVYRADVAAIVEGYGDDDLLRAVTDEYLHNPRPGRRLLWAVDRALEPRRKRSASKYGALRVLREVLDGEGRTPVAATALA